MTGPVTGLAITVASPAERPALENLVQLYIHDFSELHAGTSYGDVADDGRYVVDFPLYRWWQAGDHVPMLFRVDGRLAGFALLNAAPHGATPVDRNIAEFFVMRKYRRSGVGTAAAQTLFSRHPGRWEAAVMRRNRGARAFWQRAITSHPALTHVETAERSHFSWDGTIFRFDIAPA
ncbi:GNAT family N-acetyltransferase [Polymorphobacter fuscus]|uniref:GNAT family N-acetyltransferase n=1 Tax=Sandarakinorhabdus fusca TaxID=1439888 RepID=A0A7C9KN48_9SPHN|nr:GNAT family N-acetyltransferase [Polymorphobacter fuscus]KAB7646232.1 GNAT family N-acetyltransferase [Polymorphobacter fuscus]MQT17444.1 GNAT family N-acetyltransferase [Polymorphobacter fuscus]NJC10019.1 putative acetyltransferase [Polymorphobacter fuscus]